MTLLEAKELQLTWGKHAGKKLGEVAELDVTYLDFLAPLRQPVSMGQLVLPGRYSRRRPLRFSFSHFGAPMGAAWRLVRPAAKDSPALHEVELRFHDGQRLVFGAADLAALPVRAAPPANPREARALNAGLGTPAVVGNAQERGLPEPDEYLLFVDEAGDALDRQELGVDGVLLWREGQGKAARLHLWLVGYERIAVVAHLSIPFTPVTSAAGNTEKTGNTEKAGKAQKTGKLRQSENKGN